MRTLFNISLIAAICFYASACSTLQSNSGKSLATVATTVDAAMTGWAAWVATGKVNQLQQDSVKSVYQHYQVAMSIALNAYLALQTSKDPTAYNLAYANLLKAKDEVVSTTTSFKLSATN